VVIKQSSKRALANQKQDPNEFRCFADKIREEEEDEKMRASRLR